MELTQQTFYYLWLASGLAGLLLVLWLAYRLVRWGLGHIRIEGVWFTQPQLDALLDRLQSRAKEGVILQAQENNLLDKYRPDWRPHLKRLGDQEFVDWIR
ncbi:hypothetical protein FBQ96_07015 [Nitrospirales bacterium NOB]|nr:hypothetical protein [Nitrospirales bacterium NOB]